MLFNSHWHIGSLKAKLISKNVVKNAKKGKSTGRVKPALQQYL